MVDVSELRKALERREEEIKRLWYYEPREGLVFRQTEATVQAVGNKGYDVSEARKLLTEGDRLFEEGKYNELLMLICDIHKALREAPKIDEPFEAPATLEGIKAAWPKRRTLLTTEYDLGDYYDKVYGGWLGKNIGGALGEPVEGWTYERIKAVHGEVWDYIKKPPSTFNDDTTYEILLIHAIEEYGPHFTSEQLGREWVGHLPIEYTYTAERIAIENLKRGIRPPLSGSTDNPFSQWIGAQMKGEVCGFIAPGRPDIALEYAYRDGIIAHEKEGVYGEIFDAVLISAAFVEKDVRQLLDIGLSYVPEKSKFAKVVRDAIAWCEKASSWEEAWQEVERTYAKRYHWVHTFPNIAIVVIGLLFGEGDFEKTLCITNMCGLDTDCTAGQAGAIAGVLVGGDAIPAKWKDPLRDKFDTYVIDFEHLKISEFAERTCAIGRQVLAVKG